MNNNYSTLKLNQSTKKIILARFNPARNVRSLLTEYLPNKYSGIMDFNNISRVLVDGVNFSITTNDPPGFGEYSFDTDTGEFKIHLLDLPDDQYVIIEYYLFFTNDYGRYISEDPTDSMTTMRYWEARIKGDPSVLTSQEDIIDGYLSVGNTTLQLINNDQGLLPYFSNNDSYSKREIKIWHCLDDVENYSLFFLGYASSFTISNTISISLDNLFNVFNNTYYHNGDASNSTFNNDLFSVVFPEKENLPIPKIFSECSRTIDQNSEISQNGLGALIALTGSLQSKYIFSSGVEAVNTAWTTSRQTNNNRIWNVCFASTASSTQTEIISGVSTNIYGQKQASVADAKKYRPGDNIAINGTWGFYIDGVDFTNNLIFFTNSTSISNGDTIVRPAISMVQLFDENGSDVAMLEYDRDYTISVDGTGTYRIILEDNFEANYPTSSFNTAAIIGNNRMLCRVYNHDDLLHGNIVKEILESTGLPVNTASITNANLTNIVANFSIPYQGESTTSSIGRYLQDFFSNTLGYLSINNDGEIEYNLLESFTATNEIDNDKLLNGSISSQIDYKDIYSDIRISNEHGEKIIENRISTLFNVIDTSNTSTFSSTFPTFVHGIKREKVIRGLTKEFDVIGPRLINILSQQRNKYSFTTKGINFETIIGDEFILNTNKVVGGQKQIKIFSLEKKLNETNIVGLDLLGL